MQSYQTKKEKVYCELKKDIISGVIKPGVKLTISDLAKRFHVSEIPVREALQVMVQEGYLTSTPFVGFAVSNVSEEDVRKTFELRIALESLAARLAVKNITNANIDTLTEMWEDSKSYLEPLDFAGYWKFNHEFHDYIYQFANNEKLTSIITELVNYSSRYPQYYTSADQIKYSINEHQEIIKVLASRDEQHVEDMLKAHTVVSYHTVLRRLRGEQ